jgi:hypothetical protein
MTVRIHHDAVNEGQERQKKILKLARRRWLALLAASLAFPAGFCVLVLAATWLLTVMYGWNHPHDYSAGDTSGWALIYLSPVLLPVFLILAALGAVATYAAITRRIN